MKTVTFYVAGMLCLLAARLSAQDKPATFEDQAREISKNIEIITKQQKDSLKIEVEAVNVQLDKNEITQEQAVAKKQQYSEMRAKNIETKVAVEEEKLSQLVKDKVDGKIESKKRKKGFSFTYEDGDEEKDSTKVVKHYDFKRTTSQFVFALGINRLMTDGKVDTDNYEDGSDFYEWGAAWNTRIFKANNLLHFKYGLSLQYNNLRPKDDKVFVADGSQTVLADSGRNLNKVRLRYVNLVVPMHLEFDFTPKTVNGDKTYYPIHKSLRLGVGGYAGVNVKEKQILKYKNDDGNRVRDKTKGDFNVNDFVYGLSAYIGFRDISVYAKYDLQSVFNSNDVDQNNFSLGLRFDFN